MSEGFVVRIAQPRGGFVAGVICKRPASASVDQSQWTAQRSCDAAPILRRHVLGRTAAWITWWAQSQGYEVLWGPVIGSDP